jgi:Rap1a immunity proteins
VRELMHRGQRKVQAAARVRVLMRWAAHLAIVAVLLSAQAPAAAQGVYRTGNELLSDCRQETGDFLSGVCTGYITATNDLISTYQITKSATRLICVPVDVTVGQLRGIVVQYLIVNPDKRHYAAASSVLVALYAAFPCPK